MKISILIELTKSLFIGVPNGNKSASSKEMDRRRRGNKPLIASILTLDII